MVFKNNVYTVTTSDNKATKRKCDIFLKVIVIMKNIDRRSFPTDTMAQSAAN